MKRRTLSFFLCIALSTAAFWTGLFTMGHWDDLWSGGDYLESASLNSPLYDYRNRLEQMLELTYADQWRGPLLYAEQERLEFLRAALEPGATFFRYQVHDQQGRLIADNLNGQLLEDAAAATRMTEHRYSLGEDWYEQDYWRSNPETGVREILMVATEDGFVPVDPADSVGLYNQYGYLFEGPDGESSYGYATDEDQRVRSVQLVIECGVSPDLSSAIQDAFWEDRQDFYRVQQYLPAAAITAALTTLAAVWLMGRRCRWAGRDPATGALAPAWQDRLPLELYLTGDFLLILLFISAADTAAYSFNLYENRAAIVGLALFSLLTAAVAVLLVETLAVRAKSGTLLSCSFCGMLWRKLRQAFSDWPMVSRAVILFCLYLLGTVLSTLTLVLIPFYQGFVLWHICRYVKQWKAIQAGTARMVEGETEVEISTHRLYPDLKEHAQQLNDLGEGMTRAVDERIKGERFKAELITNVSHDLKTPLTSIINYVDLLKKTCIHDSSALEYIEVLDRKSQRLKKLTEDLVEASKASTGNLNVLRERLGFTQLLTQALGEYEEKLGQAGLETMTAMPDHELFVEADGRHLWRVIDNLLGNCAKYAMAGTRVYIDVKAWDGTVSLSVKNISRTALNISAERLTERFVRGEESRSTEGSGLGLSIARSLTELQGGTFRIDIDGDLFKAVVTFPEYKAPIPLAEGGL